MSKGTVPGWVFIPRSIEDKQQKDDRRDAQRFLDAVVSPNRKYKTLIIPGKEAEAARDLVRTYYDLVLAANRLKMQFFEASSRPRR